ncbi:MAG: ATP-binding protein [Gemmatimonadales bacterium]
MSDLRLVIAEAVALRAELEARNAELQEANQHLVIAAMRASDMAEAATRADDRRQRMEEFLAMLAHELRNPLAPISTATAILERSEGDPATVKWVQGVLRRQLVHLTRLLDDLLDASRVTRGKILLKRESVSLRSVVDAAVDETRSIVTERDQNLTVTLPDADATIDGDLVRLTQVVCNLLHNASKFTPTQGSLALTADVAADMVTVHVIDNGAGISAETLPLVFDLFSQGDHSLSRSAGGLGIGLTVVQSIVELHGGTVSVRSEGVGHGSEFVVTLPRAKRDAPLPVDDQGRPQVAQSGRRIVLIDDNVDAASAMSILLELAGHEVEVSHDGLKGFDCIVQKRPDVVVCDIGLPGIDGYEVARRVLSEIPEPPLLIAMTGYGQREDHERSLAAGFAAHLVKPVDPERVLACIEQLADLARGARP